MKRKQILHSLSFICFFGFLPLAKPIYTQESPRIEKNEGTRVKNKILIVPFENKLYMSEIDMYVNKETKWSAKQIRHYFRAELDKSIRDKFSENYTPVSLMKDTAKSKKDLGYIHNSIGYAYDPISGEKKEGIDAKNSPKPKIKNGQVVVETDDSKRFMNTVIAVKDMLDFVKKKFDTEYIVFINELDIKKSEEGTYDLTSDTYQRIVSVHYSIVNKEGKKINAGMVTCSFSSKINDPKKIVSSCFPNLAKAIHQSFSKAIAIPPAPKK